MSKLGIDDYPLSEQRPELIRGRGGKPLERGDTRRAWLGARSSMEDLRITAEALDYQAQIARAAGRPTLADNFDRAGELVDVPQDFIMQVYELLRPGRARSKAELTSAAAVLRKDYGAKRLAAFIEEAAEVYERRGLFAYRY